MPEIVPASRTRLTAIASGPGAPTASTTTATPRPSVAARTACFGSSSVRCSGVAPKRSAMARRSGTESIAKNSVAPEAIAACPPPRAETARSQAQHGDRVTGAHPRVGDRVVAGAHHVAGEQRHLVDHPIRDPAQGQVGPRNQQLLGLGALQVAEVGAVAEGPPPLAAVVVAAQAGGGGRAGGVEAAEPPVPDSAPLDVVARREQGADELVADREAGLDRHPPVVDVEVGAADPARLDPDHPVLGRNRPPPPRGSDAGRWMPFLGPAGGG